jgi:hypothetical protein
MERERNVLDAQGAMGTRWDEVKKIPEIDD